MRLRQHTTLKSRMIATIAITLIAFTGGAAADRAVGPMLEDVVLGETGVTASRAITFDQSFTMEDTSLAAGLQPFNQFLGVMDDDGVSFTAAVETELNSSGEFNVPIANHSNANAAALFSLDVPQGLEVDLDSDIEVSHARVGGNRWMLTVGTLGGNVYLRVRPKGGELPGEFSISGQLEQFSG